MCGRYEHVVALGGSVEAADTSATRAGPVGRRPGGIQDESGQRPTVHRVPTGDRADRRRVSGGWRRYCPERARILLPALARGVTRAAAGSGVSALREGGPGR